MAQLKFGSAGVTVKEIDLSAPTQTTPTGVPAGIIGTANYGPAFVPMTFGSANEFYAMFGQPDGEKYGPLAVNEWMKNAGSVTYVRTLGIGDGNKRDVTTGEVNNAGFIVGDKLPDSNGAFVNNPYANNFQAAIAAIGSIRAVSAVPADYNTGEYQIISTDGTTRNYLFDSTNTLGNSGDAGPNPGQVVVQINGLATVNAVATELKTAINNVANGHGTKITVAGPVAGVLTLTQATAGVTGNTTITAVNALAPNVLTKSNFVGGANAYTAPAGRTYFLGCFMSESAGSNVFSSAGIQGPAQSAVILRGLVMAPSGVVLRLSASAAGVDSSAPASSLVANEAASHGASVGSVDISNSKQEFVMLLNGHKGSSKYPNFITASFSATSPNYFANVFNSDPLKIEEAGHFLYSYWNIPNVQAILTGSGRVADPFGAASNNGLEALAFIVTGSAARNTATTYAPNYESFRDRFSHASTPWFVSQKFGGAAKNLFKLHALSAGADFSKTYKVSVENLVPSSDPNDLHGTFDVVIRKLTDLDTVAEPVEQWRGLSLDPSSDRYISKVIGDTHIYFDFDHNVDSQKLVVDGTYENASNLVRVEVSDDVENKLIPQESLPFGFRGLGHLVTSGSVPISAITQPGGNTVWNSINYTKNLVEPPVPFRSSISSGTGVKKRAVSQLYWGVQFETPQDITKLNDTTLKNKSITSYSQYYPNFSVSTTPFWVSDNAGAADTAENGVIDADRFCNNFFSLENILVVTGSDGLAAPSSWASATYVRTGSLGAVPSQASRPVALKDFTSQNRRFLKYTTLFQGGFNGVNILDADSADLTNAAVHFDMTNSSRGYLSGPNVAAYRKAIDIMKNVTDVDIQLLAIPDIRVPAVTDYALSAVEDRFDALYLMDIEQYDDNESLLLSNGIVSVRKTAQKFIDRNVNSSFGAAYFPDIVVLDPATSTNVTAPPSVSILGALALNDAVGHPWFAPAGFTRGALNTALAADVKLSKDNMDTLYDAKINPIVSFPGTTANPAVQSGLVVWGQKTLQLAASALDRINVRRLLIEVRRQVRQVSQTIIFEPNREATLARFSAAVTPILSRIQSLAGVERFKVVIDASTTTQQDVENNTVRGKIYLQPTKSIEFVSLDFVVTNNIAQQ